MKTYEITFSPTGGTKRAAHRLAAALNREIISVDLTEYGADFESVAVSAEDLCVIAVPAYGGRVPAAAAERLAGMNGCGAKAVLMAVYGNRAFDDTLIELYDIAVQAGFTPIAAVGALAEHSLVRCYGAGRPDAEDCAELEEFAGKILEAAANEPAGPLYVPGNRPYKAFGGLAVKPFADESCTACGLCAEQCPMNAIPKDAPGSTCADRCITCMRCVSVCPVHARKIDAEFAAGLEKRLEPVCSGRKINELFL